MPGTTVPPAPTAPPIAPGGLPVLGHARQLLSNRLGFLQELRAHGDVVTVTVGSLRLYVVNSPALMREVLIRRAAEFGNSEQYLLMARITGNGLLLSEGAFHRRQRRLILPAFNHARMNGYADAMSDIVDAWTDSWTDGQELAAADEFGSLATEIVVRCLFSRGIDRAAMDQVVQGMPHLMTWVGSRGLDPTGVLAKLPTPINRRFRSSLDALRTIVDRVIADRRAGGQEADDLLAMLLRAEDAETGEPMADQQVHDEVMTFLTAGTETTSRALAWSAYRLGRHPEVLARLQAEVDRVLEGGRTARFEDLPNLPYTRRVLTEVLRLYPPGYLLSRGALADTVLGGHLVPAGGAGMLSPYALHRDPALFGDPESFDPDRWSPERAADVTPEAYLAFGLGPHGCLGEGFAWTEMTIALATLVARWELVPVSPDPVTPIPTFSLACGRMPMTLVRRTPGSVRPAGSTRLGATRIGATRIGVQATGERDALSRSRP